MIVAVTGTPGTGKSTAVALVQLDLEVVYLNDVVRDRSLFEAIDEERDSVVVDLDAARTWFDDRFRNTSNTRVLIDSHLSHCLPVDRVIVLRCRPDELERRLRDRGESKRKARENAQCEALDLVLVEALEFHGQDAVYEIDTTDRDQETVARLIERVVTGEREPSAGTVSYIEYA